MFYIFSHDMILRLDTGTHLDHYNLIVHIVDRQLERLFVEGILLLRHRIVFNRELGEPEAQQTADQDRLCVMFAKRSKISFLIFGAHRTRLGRIQKKQ